MKELIAKRGVLKKERTAEKKTTKQESEEMDDKDADMKCGTVWIIDMYHEKRYKRTVHLGAYV